MLYLFTAHADEPRPTADTVEWRWLTLSLNGQTQDKAVKLLYYRQHFYMQEADLQQLRLKWDLLEVLYYDELNYYPLTEMDNVSVEMQQQSQHLQLNATPAAFEAYRSRYQHLQATPDSLIGAYANYDVQTQYSDGGATQAALVQLTAFSGTANFTNTATYNSSSPSSLLRLDSTFMLDNPANRSRFYLGDSYNQPGRWGRTVQFAGVRYSSNFSLDPGFVTYPLPSISGEAVLPSSVDILINNVRQHQQTVPQGPFELQQFPAITGSGELQLQVTDILGRTETYNQPFYIASQLLAEGLSSFSYEAGWIRKNYGLRSNDYDRAFMSATHRYGINNRITTELRTELSRDHLAAGASFSYLLADYAVADITVAASKTDDASGTLWRGGLSRQSHNFSFGFYAAYANRSFSALGQTPAVARLRNELGINLGAPLFSGSSLAAALIRRKQWDGDDFSLLSINYSQRVTDKLMLNVSAGKAINNSNDYTIGLTLSRYFGSRDSGQINLRHEQDNTRKQLQVQRNLTMGDSFGYRLLAEQAKQNWLDTEWLLQRSNGLYRANVSSFDGQAAARLSASGSIILLDNSLHSTRWISNSFALVNVGDIEGVSVMLENQVVAATDSKGNALVTGLMPYDKNYLSIEHSQLPINTSVQSLQLSVTPAINAGTIANFHLRRGKSAVVNLYRPDDSAVPAGAQVRINQQQRTYPVASNGKTYLEQLPSEALLHVTWQEKQCFATLTLTETNEPIPDLGTIYCRDSAP
ncbi:fimbria/pilus outer membrane usher protein [Rheinheimera hassiensis]|uniref:fimbria/pilus outer membrane usher protein n=1 Tax=Rheinheimera hassiensis TaxID=1193627 RepID=UPI001F05F8FC|nr:fimbria/pilus outer membrane usher protein [Rheinheimera hassiensis]